MATFSRSKGTRSSKLFYTVCNSVKEVLFFNLTDAYLCSYVASPLRSSAPDNLRRSGSFGKSSGRNLHLAASFDSKSGYVHTLLTLLLLASTIAVVAILTLLDRSPIVIF